MDINNSNLKTLLGYDNRGAIFVEKDILFRNINKDYFKEVMEIYEIYQLSHLNRHGIVKTEFIEAGQVFKHQKHLISYPYEWSAEMFKDAILFHINLFIELDHYGLTLKDAIPSNILFNYTKPVFVDFLSLVKNENIENEKWLVEGNSFKDKRFAIADKMLIPFMFKPLVEMNDKDYKKARRMLSEGSCNVKVERSQAIEKNAEKIRRFLKRNLKKLKLATKRRISINAALYSFKFKKNLEFVEYLRNLYELVDKLDVAPVSSPYASYYDEKKENFSFRKRDNWGAKQKNVCHVLEKIKPKTVIDLGANTGWFSFLAESIGSEVISMDIDEDCVNTIYRIAKQESKKILPLLISFEDLTRKYYGYPANGQEYVGRDFDNIPLFLAPIDRFQVDMILCLGLIHHLILGAGYEIDFVFHILSKMTKANILIEFVGINDPLIKQNPTFFNQLNKYNEKSYNIDLIIEKGKKYFKYVEVFDSHPATRKLLLFKNQD